MNEYSKEKLNNLIQMRTNLFAVVIVLTGGLFSMLFMNISIVKIILLMSIGTYFDFIFISNLLSTNQKIEKCLEELRNECK